ncbi:MAG: hypothetical protein KIG98_07530 [Comamonas sp.]|nr:hypothetical protein [Comamonas sp.]
MNLFKQFLDLLPPRPLEVGTVQSTHNGIATIELPGGGVLQARGEATQGQRPSWITSKGKSKNGRLGKPAAARSHQRAV